MGHRQAVGNNLARWYVDDNPAIAPMIAPSSGDIGFRDAGDIGGLPITHRQPVEVTAILGGDPVDEGRLPDRSKAVDLVQSGQTVKARQNEDRCLVTSPRMDVMHIHIARGASFHGNINCIEPVAHLTRLQKILKAPKLIQ